MMKLARALFALGLTVVAIAGAVVVVQDAHAACRMRPQCSVDADCDAICGAGQGNCVHSNCPIRICKCR